MQGICKSHSPEVMFLCETKNIASTVEEKCKRVGFQKFFCVNPRGTAGGLALAWKDEADIVVQHNEDFLIHFLWTDRSLQK